MSNLQEDTVRHVSEITGHGGRISVTFYFGVFLFCLPLPLPVASPSLCSLRQEKA